MQYFVKSNTTVEVNNVKINLNSPIKTILDFGDCIIILLGLQGEKEYDKVDNTRIKKTSNLVAINNIGKLLWQVSNKYIDEIRKVIHETPLIIIDDALKKEVSSTYDLLISFDKWNFYLNPKTGEKIREERVEK